MQPPDEVISAIVLLAIELVIMLIARWQTARSERQRRKIAADWEYCRRIANRAVRQ